MRHTVKRIFTLLALSGVLFLSGIGTAYGQGRVDFDDIMNGNSVYGDVTGLVDQNPDETPEDTVKKPPRIRKPLESYFFPDSVRANQIFTWSIVPGYNDIKYHRIDTALMGLQNDYPYIQNDVGSAYLGNLGGAFTPLNYFLRPDYNGHEFWQPYDGYMTSVERARFFNVKVPFTHASYTFAGQTTRLEENFHLVHAQNISPSSGFNVEYRSMGTRGSYQNQTSRAKALSVGFSHTGKKYTLHAGYIYNAINNKENGGIFDDREITDTVLELPELVTVNLKDAKNVLKNNSFYVSQSYGIPLRKLDDSDFSIADRPGIFIGHILEYNRYSRKYSDTRSNSEIGDDGKYYDHWFINSSATNDSIFESVLSNKLYLQIQPWDRNGAVGVINAGIGHDMHYFSGFAMDDYFSGIRGVKKNSTYVYGSLEGSVSRYLKWHGNLEYHPFGYRSQDISVGGGVEISAWLRGSPVTLKGDLVHETRTPGYWTENYYSNHFVWNNSFSKEDETRFSLTLDVPAIGFEAGFSQSAIGDKIYYGNQMTPVQKSGSVNVTGVYAKKNLRFGGLNLNHRVLLQYSTDQDVVPVPTASAYLSYFFEFNVVRDVLRMQIGLDGRYFTEYYAFGYNPATGQFHTQNENKIGNYPYIDAFVAAKWKRMRITIKMQHLNENLSGDRNYFNVLHYPLNRRMLKFGFSWAFYD